MSGKLSKFGSVNRVEIAPSGFKQPKPEWQNYRSYERRGTLRVHSDADFRRNRNLDIEYPTVSSAGCLKLNIECQEKFNSFVANGGKKLIVREN